MSIFEFIVVLALIVQSLFSACVVGWLVYKDKYKPQPPQPPQSMGPFKIPENITFTIAYAPTPRVPINPEDEKFYKEMQEKKEKEDEKFYKDLNQGVNEVIDTFLGGKVNGNGQQGI